MKLYLRIRLTLIHRIQNTEYKTLPLYGVFYVASTVNTKMEITENNNWVLLCPHICRYVYKSRVKA